ncbi:hypothetical protein CDL15_Pgr026812 [Punica granatum]|nr:hypothetical protein CDL15_Pgr026812 [Punica granatum]
MKAPELWGARELKLLKGLKLLLEPSSQIKPDEAKSGLKEVGSGFFDSRGTRNMSRFPKR